MRLSEFAAEVIIISSSGVLAPGPLFFASLLYGSKQGLRAGLKIAYGHTIVELAIIILLSSGLVSFLAIAKQYTDIIGIVGGIGILAFASLQLSSLILGRKRKGMSEAMERKYLKNEKGPFVTGIALSALNPFFLLWWFTAGLKLISDSYVFGMTTGIAILFFLHIWMDYAWLVFTAHMASRGVSIFKSKYYYTAFIFGLTIALVYYGIQFLISGLG